MTQYKPQKIAGLKLYNLPKNASINHYRYTIELESSETTTFSDKKKRPFNKNNETEKIYINHSETKVCVTIYQGDKIIRSLILRHYDQKSGTLDSYNLQGGSTVNSTKENHIKEHYIDEKIEVGWLLIRKSETVDSLLKRIYKNPPTLKEFSLFRNNNIHIKDIENKNVNTVLLPSQVVILSNKYGNDSNLNHYKKLAKSIEEKRQKLSQYDDFDGVLLSENYELLSDYWQYANEMVLSTEIPEDKVATFKKRYCGDDGSFIEDTEKTTAAVVGYIDEKDKVNRALKENEILKVKEDAIKKANAIGVKIDSAYKYEKSINSELSRASNFKRFRKKYRKFYYELDQIAKSDFQAVEKVNYNPALKKHFKDYTLLRNSGFRGGLKRYDEMIEKLGRISTGLKQGKFLVVGLGISISALNILEAYSTGDDELAKKVLKIEGGAMLAGAVAGFVVAGAVVLIIGTGGSMSPFVIAAGSAVIGNISSDKAKDYLAEKAGVC